MTTLIEQLLARGIPDWATARELMTQAANTIKALQVAIERKKESYAALEQKAVICKEELLKAQEEKDALQAEVERLDRESQNLSNQLGDCDRARLKLLTELAALKSAEPVGTAYKHWINAEMWQIKAVLNKDVPEGTPLYAGPAPQAPAPEAT